MRITAAIVIPHVDPSEDSTRLLFHGLDGPRGLANSVVKTDPRS